MRTNGSSLDGHLDLHGQVGKKGLFPCCKTMTHCRKGAIALERIQGRFMKMLAGLEFLFHFEERFDNWVCILNGGEEKI